jgi:localization factor PodJL
VQELVNLQFQQNTAALSSRLGNTAGHLSPADLMPEEVARMQVRPASLGSAREPGDSSSVPATVEPGRTVSPLALPPATVGPLSLRIAAANGDPSAAFEVGARLAEGKGTDQNFRDALTWYQKSAAQGFAQAQYRLGTLYERGLGVKADMGRARLWYQRAAEQGNVKAMHNLAVLSAGRETGTPDYTSAAQWFTAAAEYGLADSQYNLAVLYENGLGVPKDDVQAFKWYALAAASGGDKEAARRRDAFLEAMVEPVRGQAERQVATFRSKRVVPLVNDARVAGEDWKKRLERGGSG